MTPAAGGWRRSLNSIAHELREVPLVVRLAAFIMASARRAVAL